MTATLKAYARRPLAFAQWLAIARTDEHLTTSTCWWLACHYNPTPAQERASGAEVRRVLASLDGAQ